ncbi:hypothetical protein CU254_20160 [Amycolatopsis sp. AA4]|nr:hypothetical protein CU254_20160 [Amycolatopsis sp. AA4]
MTAKFGGDVPTVREVERPDPEEILVTRERRGPERTPVFGRDRVRRLGQVRERLDSGRGRGKPGSASRRRRCGRR